MIRYQYATEISPPAPFIQMVFRHPTTHQSSNPIPAQIDSGADRTVIPKSVVENLNLVSVRQIMVAGFGGALHALDEYILVIHIHDLTPFLVPVIAHTDEAFVLLGRDVLNRLRIVLDGPNQILEIG